MAKQTLAVSMPIVAADTVKEVLEEDDNKPKFAMPDIRQMTPFKPQLNVRE